jgi:hypothetical protein
MKLRTFLVTVKDNKIAGIREFADGSQAGLELNKIIDSISTPAQEFDSAFVEHARADEWSRRLIRTSLADHTSARPLSHGLSIWR